MKKKNYVVRLIRIILESEVQNDLKIFFAENPDFDLQTSKIKEEFKKAKTGNIKNKEALIEELKQVQRIFK